MGLFSGDKSYTTNESITQTVLGGAAGYGGASLSGEGNTATINVTDSGAIQGMSDVARNSIITQALLGGRAIDATLLTAGDAISGMESTVGYNTALSLGAIDTMAKQNAFDILAMQDTTANAMASTKGIADDALAWNTGVSQAAIAGMTASQNSTLAAMLGLADTSIGTVTASANKVLGILQGLYTDSAASQTAALKTTTDTAATAIKVAAASNAASQTATETTQAAMQRIVQVGMVIGALWLMGMA